MVSDEEHRKRTAALKVMEAGQRTVVSMFVFVMYAVMYAVVVVLMLQYLFFLFLFFFKRKVSPS